jgi:methylated-DNA-[protein]-cysteine S-methyltransferase
MPTQSELRAGYLVTPDELRRLHERLGSAAAADRLVDVAYRTVDSPVGRLLLAATEVGLVRVAFAAEDDAAVLQELADRISPRVLHVPHRLDAVATQLEEYFDRRRHRFDVGLDWQLSRGFRRAVLTELGSGVDYGQTASYAELARRTGRPKASRAVGTACATNPIPIVIPCHRVIRADGAIGAYRGGVSAKRALLALEAGSG